MTAILSCTSASSSFGFVVSIVQVSTARPSEARHLSHRPAKVNREPPRPHNRTAALSLPLKIRNICVEILGEWTLAAYAPSLGKLDLRADVHLAGPFCQFG